MDELYAKRMEAETDPASTQALASGLEQFKAGALEEAAALFGRAIAADRLNVQVRRGGGGGCSFIPVLIAVSSAGVHASLLAKRRGASSAGVTGLAGVSAARVAENDAGRNELRSKVSLTPRGTPP